MSVPHARCVKSLLFSAPAAVVALPARNGPFATDAPTMRPGIGWTATRAAVCLPELSSRTSGLASDPVDTAQLEDLISRVARLADDLPEVAVLELNPVVVGVDGSSVLGATVVLTRPQARTDRGARALLG